MTETSALLEDSEDCLMDKQYKKDLEDVLGVSLPWSVVDVELDKANRAIEVILSYQPEKNRFSFISKSTSQQYRPDSLTQSRWRHVNLGQYACFTKIDASAIRAGGGILQASIATPAFIGDIGKSYTHHLKQQVSLCSMRGFDVKTIASVLHINESMTERVLSDISKTSISDRPATYLPTEIDDVWRDILSDRMLIKTQMLPLKLLLSKLKLAVSSTKDADILDMSIRELRQFFVTNSRNLESEYAQLCGLSMDQRAVAQRSKAANRLILPSLKNPIWIHILNGKLNLKSNNMSLNLLLVRQRSTFQNSEESDAKIRAISALRDFFKKNARGLRSELVLINRVLQNPDRVKNKVALPESNHKIWQKILRDDSYVPSNHMAYKLLLSKLRSTLLMNTSPEVELDAAKRIRDFYLRNQKSMQEELRALLKQNAA